MQADIGNAGASEDSLLHYYQAALNQNANYRAALEDYRAAAEAEPQALARLLPKIGLEGAYNRIRQEIDGEFFGITDVDETDYFDKFAYGVSLRQPIYQRSALLGLDRAELAVGQARLRLTAERHDLMLRTAEAYFGVLAAGYELSFIRAEKEAIARQVEQTESRFDSGLVAETDLLAVKAQLDSVKASEIDAENALDIARTRLEFISGQRPDRIRTLNGDAELPALDPNQVEPWLERAQRHNTDLLAETVGLNLAEVDTDIARAQRWPTLQLTGSHAFFDADGGFEGAREDTDSRIGLSLRMPLYEGGMVRSQVTEAQARQRAAAHQRDSAETQARLATRTAFLNTRAALARADALVQAVDSAQAAEASAQIAFEVGSRTAADYLAAVRERFRAQRDLARARYDYLLGLLRLRKAAGVLRMADLEAMNRVLQ
ncbi:TolC family outer membrane protein [Algiphilus sp.]|uniref:TolC family outer membrane protein n=1 Tax=Algiphilus sp. TaxID=1872431 RepID=UPI003B51BCB8